MILNFSTQELKAILNRVEQINNSSIDKLDRAGYLMTELSLTRVQAEEIIESLEKGIYGFHESYDAAVSSDDMLAAIEGHLDTLNESEKKAYLINVLALIKLRDSDKSEGNIDEYLKDFRSQKSLESKTIQELILEIQSAFKDTTYIPGINEGALATDLESLKEDENLSAKIKEYVANESYIKSYAMAIYVCMRRGEISVPDSLKDGEIIDPLAVGVAAAAGAKKAEATSDYLFGKISKEAFLKTLRIISAVAFWCLIAYAAYLCLVGATMIAFATIYLGLSIGPLATVLAVLGSGYFIYETFMALAKVAEVSWQWSKDKYLKFEAILSSKLSCQNGLRSNNYESDPIYEGEDESEITYA